MRWTGQERELRVSIMWLLWRLNCVYLNRYINVFSYRLVCVISTRLPAITVTRRNYSACQTSSPTLLTIRQQGGGYVIILSTCEQNYWKKWADFIETWCYDWAYQSEELINFWWGSALRYGFRINFEFSSPFISISHTVTGRFSRNLAKWLMPTR